jgi:flagellar hook assembly protein FlgD
VTLPESDQVSLLVFDVTGKLVRSVVGGRFAAGPHTLSWDGLDESGKDLPSGAYLLRITTSSLDETRLVVKAR